MNGQVIDFSLEEDIRDWTSDVCWLINQIFLKKKANKGRSPFLFREETWGGFGSGFASTPSPATQYQRQRERERRREVRVVMPTAKAVPPWGALSSRDGDPRISIERVRSSEREREKGAANQHAVDAGRATARRRWKSISPKWAWVWVGHFESGYSTRGSSFWFQATKSIPKTPTSGPLALIPGGCFSYSKH